jgi:outer membrane receptor protein involved in Fe transport
LGNVKITPSAFVGNVAVMYAISRKQTLYAALSTGYRAPNVDDMGTLGIVDFRYEIPVSNLKPEQSVHTEVGYKFSGAKLKAEVSVYHLQLRNIITRVKVDGQLISGYQVYKKENSEKAIIKGAEAEFNWQATRNYNISGSASYTYGQNYTRNEPLRRVPPFNGRIMSLYRKNKIFVAAEFLFASKQDRLAQGDKDDNRIPKGGTPGWNVINLYTGYQTRPFCFNIGFQNLLNEDYRTHGSGINGVGRSAYISVTVNL